MYNANQLLELLKNELAHDEASKGRIKNDYSKYLKLMGPSDARTFTAAKFLAERMKHLDRDVSD